MTNKDIGERIADARKRKSMTQAAVAKATGVNKSTIQRYEAGLIEKIKLPVIESIAKTLGVNPAWLIGKSEEMIQLSELGRPYNPTHRIPLLGRISAGLPLYAEEHIEGHMYTELSGNGEYFGLRVRGDSMSAANIHEGNVIVVRKQPVVENGQIAVVLVNGEDATVKRFYKEGDIVTLMPQSHNPEHHPQVYDSAKVRIEVLGRVVQNTITFE